MRRKAQGTRREASDCGLRVAGWRRHKVSGIRCQVEGVREERRKASGCGLRVAGCWLFQAQGARHKARGVRLRVAGYFRRKAQGARREAIGVRCSRFIQSTGSLPSPNGGRVGVGGDKRHKA